jgi:hypothetical protein
MAPAADPAKNLPTKVAVAGSLQPNTTLMGSYKPNRNEVYEASRNQAALTPFHKPRTPSSPETFLMVPNIPNSANSELI